MAGPGAFVARAGLVAVLAGVAVHVPCAQERSEPVRSWQVAWEARQAQEAGRREAERVRRDYERRRAIAHARMRSNPDTTYPSLPPPADSMCPVYADPEARREFQRRDRQRRGEAFSRATGLPLRTGYSVHPVPKRGPAVLSGGPDTNLAMAATPRPYSVAVFGAASATSASASGHRVPYFPSASDALGRQGFARVINHSDEAGEATIEAFDDEGISYGPLRLSIDARETVHFNSDDLEDGNAGKGLSGSTGPGQGGWRLEVDSGLDIEVLSYIRTTDGFLTAMHDTAPAEDGRHDVAVFNPGSNQNQESRLRLVNLGDGEATATIAGVDDRGMSPGEGATVTIPAYASRTYTAAELEGGGAAGLTGSIGDGAGKWRLVVESEQDIVAMSLLSSPTGHLTNLSTAPRNEADGIRSVPLFPSAADANGRQGFVRVVNRSEEAGEVTIRAFDDTDAEYEALTVAIGAKEAKHFNSDDLELGNTDKGLAGSTGAGEGDWRLELTSELGIRVLSYIRTEDGFLTAMHDTAPRSAKRHRVAVFNPGSNADQESRLRLVNPGDGDAQATIVGFDGNGETPGSDVVVVVPAGSTTTLTAQQLEAGSADFEGALGDGAGKWSLTVTADRAITAMNLLSSPTGHLTNLSTAPQRGAGPVETAAEAFEALISSVIESDCSNCHVVGGQSGHTPLVFVKETDADHVAKNLKVFEDYVATEEDGAAVILDKIQGARGHHGGVRFAAHTDEYAHFVRFMELLGAAIETPAFADLFGGVTTEQAWETLRRAAIVFAGRIPTEKEYAAVEEGTEDDLREAIRGLMDGPGFHEFLLRGSNDRLLTDRGGTIIDAAATDEFVAYSNLYYQKSTSGVSDDERYQWFQTVDYGVRRAPLELIAHIVQDELPYTRILTADYIMANPPAAEAYGASTVFDDAEDVYEFKPSRIESYYRDHQSKDTEYSLENGTHVINPGILSTDYPHAGILNTTVFLLRYPTTATNRNRARSRWTYYHFLGFDIEKSKQRTMNPDVLKDTNNPTMHNPACTGCHKRMDPVAGAFQNYGDRGMYRDQWGGMDSLDGFYKLQQDPSGGHDLTVTLRSEEEEYETFEVDAALRPGDNDIGMENMPVGEHTPNILVDSLTIRDGAGEEIDRYNLEEMEDWDNTECGNSWGSAGVDIYCRVVVLIEVPEQGDYTIEVAARISGGEGESGALRIWAPMRYDYYHDGDTWYRDMRDPGFVDAAEIVRPVPDDRMDDSLRWLAHRIVEDDRFAEATVKFWWPSVMGSEVAEPPEDESDAAYEGMLLAFNAQDAEVKRLAKGFRDGFGGGSAYDLKDLLVEIVLSPWFRADSVVADDPIRSIALAAAGAKRLLTPEELARKTLALGGFAWGRGNDPWRTPIDRYASNLTDRDRGYGLLYGGIDSAGVTERARDLNSVMAAVAQSHAMESSCPIVRREIYLLSNAERQLFRNVDKDVTPAWEFGETFEIKAASAEEIETVSLEGQLRAGKANVVLAFVNDFIDESGDRNLILDRMTMWSGEELIEEWEIEDLNVPDECEHFVGDDSLSLNRSNRPCTLTVPVEIPGAGTYRIDVTGWADQVGDQLAKLSVVVETDTMHSVGARTIQTNLVELHKTLLGVQVTRDSPEVSRAYDLFVDVWERKWESADTGFDEWGDNIACHWRNDFFYFDGILEDYVVEEENAHPDWDHDRIEAFHSELDWSDSGGVARTWIVVLAYLLMDYRYLYL